MSKTLALLTQGAWAQGEDVADGAIIAYAATDTRDQRDAGKLTGKQFYTLHEKVTEKTNSLFCGVQSSYNKLDPNGPAAARFVSLPGGISGLAVVKDDEVAFYAGQPTSAEEYRRITLMGKPTASSPTSDKP